MPLALLLLAASLQASGAEEHATWEQSAEMAPHEEIAEISGLANHAQSFQERRKLILDKVVSNPRAAITDAPFFVAEALFMAGKISEGQQFARQGYLRWCKRDPKHPTRATDFFRLWPAMDCYVRYKQYLDQPTKDLFRSYMTGLNCYSYSFTANLNMLMWTTRLLGGQEWGDAAFVPPAKNLTGHYKADPSISTKAHLIRMIDGQALDGGEEYASRPYGAGNLSPILALSQLATDQEIKEHARIAIESTLARYAPVWLDGSLIITSRRSYPDLFDDPMGVATWFWVFFGGSHIPSVRSHVVEAAVMGAAPPSLIEYAATDRAKPYTAENHFQLSSSGRQISWINRTYGLFSESFWKNPHPFGQTYPFGVRWVTPHAPGHTLFWFSIPSLDENNTGSHPHGFDVKCQTTMQHEGTLLYVINTEARPGGKFPYGLGYVPVGALAMINEASTNGRIFLHYPGVLIAFSATKPFIWTPAGGIRSPSGIPSPGDSEFRVPGPTFAAAIETAAAIEFPEESPENRLKKFRDAVLAKSRITIEGGTPSPTVPLAGIYSDRHGNVIKTFFAGDSLVNGQPVDLKNWSWARSPWVNQANRNSPLTIADGKTIRIYDFTKWTISEQPVKGSSAR